MPEADLFGEEGLFAGDHEPGPRPRDSLGPAMGVVFVLGIVAAGWAVAGAGPRQMLAPVVASARQQQPPSPPPAVEPLTLQALTPDQAVEANAAVPFSTAPNPAARPFRISATSEGYARAVDCLASAVYYEAGDDAVGQRAVAQVVINRLRHPAFPKTVCGVVYQGSERSTGCQFTFTCDGAMLRTPSAAAWERARGVAMSALAGYVYKPIGHATHYHTNWVVPYWSASLDKITAVGTHLFFRWMGWWGTPSAFRGRYAGSEPVIAQLGRLSIAHNAAVPALSVETALASMGGGAVQGEDGIVVTLDRSAPPDSFATIARTLCGERDYCKVMGWTDRARRPTSFPIDAVQMSAMSFSYLRNRASGFEKPLWNCTEFMRSDPRECMKIRVQVETADAAPSQRPAAAPLRVVLRQPGRTSAREAANAAITAAEAARAPAPVAEPATR